VQLSDLTTELWEELGKPAPLDPSTATGKARLVLWVNKAYKKVLFWKFPDGTQLRFKACEAVTYFQSVSVSGTIVSATATAVQLDANALNDVNHYVGWVIMVNGGNPRLIVGQDGNRTVTVHDSYGTTVPSGTYTLIKRFFKFCASSDPAVSENIALDPTTQIIEVLKVTDIKRYWDLQPALRSDPFSFTQLVQSYPRQYVHFGDQIIMDYPAFPGIWYRMEYVFEPPDLVNDDDEPQMPDFWQDAIIMWAVYRGQRWMEDFSAAYMTKRDLMDFMSLTRQQDEMSKEREDGQAEVEE